MVARSHFRLKVGRVGANSGPRFYSQHYSPGFAGSSLAKSLIRYRVMWPWLGVDHLDVSNVKSWMLQSLARAHFYLPRDHDEVLVELEVYVRARVGSVFEGQRELGKWGRVPGSPGPWPHDFENRGALATPSPGGSNPSPSAPA